MRPYLLAVCLMLVSGLGCRQAPADTSKGAPLTEPEHPLGPGELAPEFKALSHIGYSVTLSDFERRPTFVQLCPSGFDADCTALARQLRDRWLELNHRLSMALLIVPTSYTDNVAFASAEELPFLVLADTDGSISKSFGVRAGSGGNAPNTSFLIGAGREISRAFSRLSPEARVDELVRTLE